MIGSYCGWSHWSYHIEEYVRNVETSYYGRLSNRGFYIKSYYEALIAEDMGSWPRDLDCQSSFQTYDPLFFR